MNKLTEGQTVGKMDRPRFSFKDRSKKDFIKDKQMDRHWTERQYDILT